MTKVTPAKASKNIELQKQSVPNETNGQTSTKEVINGACPINGVKPISTWVCKNLACKAVIPSEDSFCKRCSCCICHKFDDNKIQVSGCFDLEQIIHLDGSFSCAACGKVSGILGYLKRQLVIGKDARRVDILCHRIYLTHKLLEGTSRFKELHEIIKDAKAKLESEVGPLDGMSAKMARGIVSRSSVGIDVQKLCSVAIQKADEWLSSPDLHLQDSLPAACRFKFADVTASSLIVILKESSSSKLIKGYKLWYWKSGEQPSTEQPVIIPKDERQILVFNLSPCTEYSFRVISFTDDGILGHSESKCYTGSMEISFKHATQNTAGGGSQMQRRDRSESFKSNGFKIRNIWKTFQESCAEEGCFEGFCENMHEGSCSRSATEAEQAGNCGIELLSGACRKLRFNSSSVPDLNAEAPMTMDNVTKQYYHSKKRLLRSNDSADSETCAVARNGEPPAVESRPDGKLRQVNIGCEHDDASAICREKQISGTRQLSEDYEHCIKVIRQLECNGHIESDFRKKFLTWYSLRSTDQERRAVTTFIKTLGEEPCGLAGQLVDSFGEIVNCKKQRTGFCNKLWH
ncbi:hypothetical protein EJB05_33933, partial [Eragrostis curvula]